MCGGRVVSYKALVIGLVGKLTEETFFVTIP